MRSVLLVLLLLALAGWTTRPTPPQAGTLDLRVCEGSVSKGSTCAHLDRNLRLEVSYSEGPGVRGRVLFTNVISASSAQELFVKGIAVIHSFDPASLAPINDDLVFFRVEVGSGVYSSSVMLPLPEIRHGGTKGVQVLRKQLEEITHAF